MHTYGRYKSAFSYESDNLSVEYEDETRHTWRYDVGGYVSYFVVAVCFYH